MPRLDSVDILIVHNLDVDKMGDEQIVCLDCGETIKGEKEINTQIDRMIEYDFVKRHKGASRYLTCKEITEAANQQAVNVINSVLVTKNTAREDFVNRIEFLSREDRIDLYVKDELMSWLTNVFDKIKE